MNIESILALLIPFAGMALAFGIVYVNRTSKTREKMAMLEKGFSPEEIKAIYEAKSKPDKTDSPYMWIGAGLGLLVGHGLTMVIEIDKVFAYLTCAFLFAGIALLIQKRYDKKSS